MFFYFFIFFIFFYQLRIIVNLEGRDNCNRNNGGNFAFDDNEDDTVAIVIMLYFQRE